MAVETRKRSIAKTLSWRVIATLITATVTWIVTGKLEVAVLVGGLDTTIKLGAYYLHERTWLKVRWGLSEYRDYQI